MIKIVQVSSGHVRLGQVISDQDISCNVKIRPGPLRSSRFRTVQVRSVQVWSCQVKVSSGLDR